ncbi:MAG: hypothetical protein JNK82_14645, partial [Myxococcaceae bacterium]|nr:hypothetical protein [Myxococcaceae bacterium]
TRELKSKKAPPPVLEPVLTVQLDASTLGNAELETCVLEAVRGWPFPPVLSRARGGQALIAFELERVPRDEPVVAVPQVPPPPKPTPKIAFDTSVGTKTKSPGKKPVKMMKPSPKNETVEPADGK